MYEGVKVMSDRLTWSTLQTCSDACHMSAATITIGDSGITYSWGFNSSDSVASDPVDAVGDSGLNDVSPWLVLLWLAIRFMIVMCPFFIVVKLMSTVHTPPTRPPDVAERDLTAVILVISFFATLISSLDEIKP